MSDALRISGSAQAARRWSDLWRDGWINSQLMVLMAATETAALEGISAAGATPLARLCTAAADAELLLLGPASSRPHALPPLAAGVSPALISHVVTRELGLTPLVVDLGCAIAPSVPHLRLPPPAGGGAARCLSGGAAMAIERVEALLRLGRRWGKGLGCHGHGHSRRDGPRRPLMIAECVPAGTTTAQAVLCGLGVAADGLMSGSLRLPIHQRKDELVRGGLAAAAIVPGQANPLEVAAAVGDPMQPMAAGMVLGAVEAGVPVMLAGGSQMAAVLALALALAPQPMRKVLAADTALATTAWVAGEPHSDLAGLLERVGCRWGVEPLGFAADLRFDQGCHPALADYELGYVKEGVGAGGLAVLWQLSGLGTVALRNRCDQACHLLQNTGGS